MNEDTGRLNLIQRAVKRVSLPMGAAPATAPHFEPELGSVMQPLRRDSLAPTAPVMEIPRPTEQGHARPESGEPAKVARVRFNDLRRQGMITPDNLRSNIAFEFRAI